MLAAWAARGRATAIDVLGARLVKELDAREEVMCGCPVTPELIQKLNEFIGNFHMPGERYHYTFETDVGTFDTHNVIELNLTNEFLILRLSQTADTHEDLYVRLCLVKSVKESFSSVGE